MNKLICEIRNCSIRKRHFKHELGPVFAFVAKSKIVVIGQALSSVVHRKSIP